MVARSEAWAPRTTGPTGIAPASPAGAVAAPPPAASGVMAYARLVTRLALPAGSTAPAFRVCVAVTETGLSSGLSAFGVVPSAV
jgi:hypothetical protein